MANNLVHAVEEIYINEIYILCGYGMHVCGRAINKQTTTFF